MELRLLSTDVDDLVDPDEETLARALNGLPQNSGENPPRAALVHSNGKDYIQFFAMMDEGKGGDIASTPCHLQYCEHHKGKPTCYYSEKADFKKAVTILLAYAKNHGWKEAVAWEPLEYERAWQVVVFGVVLILGGFFAGYNFVINGKGKAIVGALFCFGFVGLLFYADVMDRREHGTPWTSGEGSCTSGGCGSDGGDGGGGGRVTKRAVGNRFHPRLRHLPPTELLDPSMGGGG